jgi:hypothetical protein
MGRIGEVIEVRDVTVDGDNATEVTVDLGANDTVTVLDCSPSGVHSKPLKGDLVVLVEVDGAEEYALVGYIDVALANGAGSGGTYLYSRGSDGTRLAYVHLKNTGAVDIHSTDSGGATRAIIEMAANGEIKIYNAFGSLTISSTGDIKAQNSFTEVDLVTGGCLVNGSVVIAPGQNP